MGQIQKEPQEPCGALGIYHGPSGKPPLGPGQRVCDLTVTLRSARYYSESGCRLPGTGGRGREGVGAAVAIPWGGGPQPGQQWSVRCCQCLDRRAAKDASRAVS